MASKSVSLSIKLRDQILHKFWAQVRDGAKDDLLKIEHDLADGLYKLAYGKHVRKIRNLPNGLFQWYNYMPFEQVTIRTKPKKIKGEVVATQKDTYEFRRLKGCLYVSDFYGCTEACNRIHFPEGVDTVQYASSGWSRAAGHEHWLHLIKSEICTQEDYDAAKDLYVEAVKAQRKIIEPIEQAMDDVVTILTSVRTTKTLLDAWPEAEEFLELPEAPAGAIMKVDTSRLNKQLHELVKEAGEAA